MKDRKLAARYAKALLSVFPSPAQAEPADRFLESLCDAMDRSSEFRALMLDPAYASSAKKSILRSLARQHAQSPVMGNFLTTLVDNNRTAALRSIAQVFREEREAAMGVVPAEISTAVPLPEDLLGRAEAALERLTGRKVQLTSRVEPELLGGAVTRIGSTVYDGSLRTHLSQLRRKMAQE